MNKLKRTTNWLKNNFLNILVLGLSLFCLFNIIDKLDDSFTVIANSLAIFATIWYFFSFEKEIIHKAITKLTNPPHINFPQSLKIKKLNIFPLLYTYLRRYLAIGFRLLYKERWEITSYFFVLLLLIISLGQFDFLTEFIDFSWVEKYQTIIIVLAVVSGGLTMWHNRERVERKIEEEKNQEEEAEQKQKEEFGDKFPKIAKLNFKYNIKIAWQNKKYLNAIIKIILSPIIFIGRLPYSLIKWMYKEGWGYSIGLIIILIFASTLIYPNLGGHDLYHDESYQINVLDSLSKGDGFYLRNYVTDEPTISYNQGYLTEIGSYFFYSEFSKSLFWVRFFTATISLFSILFIYLIFKLYVPKSISLLIAFFVSYNIIFLYLARFFRPYSLFLLFYLVTFFLLIRLKSFKGKDNIKFIYSLMGIFLFSIGALIEREMAKILFILLPLCFIPIIINHKKTLSEILTKANRKLLFVIIFLLIGVSLFLNSLNIIHLSNMFRQIPEQFSLKIFINPTNSYYQYLLDYQTRGAIIPRFFLAIGTSYLIYTSIAKKKLRTFCLLIFSFIPLIMCVYFMNKSEDFRYIYHIVPFFAAILIFGIYIISIIIFNKKTLRLFFSIFCLILILSKPMLPFLENSNPLFIKSITKWENADGKKYLSRRAVPPDYTTAYEYLNIHQKSGDIVIITEATWNLKPNKDVEYYTLDNIWAYSKNLINLRDNTNIDFFDLIDKRNGRRVWFLGAYVHMIDPKINEYFLDNCYNVAQELDIKTYNYNSYYKNRFYWPNLFLCK